MKALVKPRRVTRNVTHFHPHPDEALAFTGAFLRPDIFIGAKDADWLFLNAGQLPPTRQRPEEYQRDKLVIGTCLSEYDEHALNVKARKRHSAASLVARDLHLRDDPAFVPLLEYAVQNDRHGKIGTWDIAAIMKAVNLSLENPDLSLATLNLGMDWFETAYAYFKMQIEQGKKPERPRGELNLNDHIVSWLLQEYDPETTIESVGLMTAADVAEKLGVAERPELQRILRLATRGHEGVAESSFDIHCWVEQAVALGRSDEWIMRRLGPIFRARRYEDTRYWQAYHELPNVTEFTHLLRHPANPEVITTTTSTPETQDKVEQTWHEKGQRCIYSIAVVQSDNPTAHRAFGARFPIPDVLIIRQSNRRTAIKIKRARRPNRPVTRKTKYGLSIKPFAIRLRENEGQLARPYYTLTFEERMRDGNLYGPDGHQLPWHCWDEGGWMLNGSFSAPDTKELPPTRLSVNLIVKKCVQALIYLDRKIRTEKAQSGTQKRKQDRSDRRPHKKPRKQEKKQPQPGFANHPRLQT